MSKTAVQIATRSTIAEVSSSLDTDAIIELYELDMGSVASIGTSDVLRFHAGTNNLDREIVWQGNVYYPYPIEVKGFEYTGNKQIPRPNLTVANITTTSHGRGWGTISGLTRDYDDLVGVQVRRKRTYGRYLDNFCVLPDNTASAGYCSESDFNDSITDCEREGYTWTNYECSTCASAGGSWHVNNNSEWQSIDNKSLNLLGSETHTHTHEVELTPADQCSLGQGNKLLKTSGYNNFSFVEIDITSVDPNTGAITGFYINNAGSGYNEDDPNLELLALSAPTLTVGQGINFPGQNPHTHSVVNLNPTELYNLVEGKITSITTNTTFQDSHTHAVEIQYDSPNQRFLATLLDNHAPGTPHQVVNASVSKASFSNIELNNQGSLISFDILDAGSGYIQDEMIVLVPTVQQHSHDVELEYLYDGTDEKVISGSASWYPSTGTTLTTSYDSGDAEHSDCIRIESNAINDYGFTDLNTFEDKEYRISFDYNNIAGSTQKLEVETDKGDGTWNLEFSESLDNTGWQTYEKTFFADDISREKRTRFKIYASDNTGGADDEILVDNFKVEQTWLRGDIIARSISSNTSDNHTLEGYNNLVINTSDPEAYFEDDIYFIDQKSTETNLFIEFALAPAWDVEGIKLPRREIIQNTCLWEYKGSDGCGYTDSRYFTKSDQPTSDASEDYCAKRLKSCELRFATAEPSLTDLSSCEAEGHYWNSSANSCWNLNKAILPYGGFPGVGLGLRK